MQAKKSSLQTRKTLQYALVGNLLITMSKLLAYMHSGSSAMFNEAVHSAVDCGNQGLLMIGLRDVGREKDERHPYGYGKSLYFWSLVSALGTFWLGAGVSLSHSITSLLHPSLDEITWHVWAVLGFSLLADGAVLRNVIVNINEHRDKSVSFIQHVKKIRDPATIAVLLEDSAACAGVAIASVGIALSHATYDPYYDSVASVAISLLLAGMGVSLARLNQRYLLGQSVDDDILRGIRELLLSRDSIDNVLSVQTQWVGPYSFSYKAEVDIDCTYLAAKLMDRYELEFMKAHSEGKMGNDCRLLLSWYAEDVMRMVEREVKDIEVEIRSHYPQAAYIELEPDSKESDLLIIDGKKRREEVEKLNGMIERLKDKLSMKEK